MPMIGKEAILPISLYIHIPFCTKKCHYCHFYVIPDNEKSKDRLLDALLIEWTRIRPLIQDKSIMSIYFGGGTPSLFGPSRVHSLIAKIKEEAFVIPSAEITLEVNPENVSKGIFESYAQFGINRISLGVQTLDPSLLTLLGRQHCPSTVIEAIHTTHRSGISNISIDLMYDVPHQTLSSWKNTLSQIEALPISHLSLYNLTIEPQTLFFKNKNQLKPFLPDPESSLAMYEMASQVLTQSGFQQYEISAFAKPNCQSQHNMGYWTGRSFFGLGPSAFSYWEGRRFRNIANLNRYCDAMQQNLSSIDFEEKLEDCAKRRELLVIGLRLLKGVEITKFENQHGKLDDATKTLIEQLIEKGWMKQEGSQLFLTKSGVLFYDDIASDLI